MLKDRVYGIRETLFHDPYYQRHVVGAPLVRERRAPSGSDSEANYAVFRTKLNELEHGVQRRPLPRRRRAHAGGPEVRSRALVVYDSEMIPNSIIYPI